MRAHQNFNNQASGSVASPTILRVPRLLAQAYCHHVVRVAALLGALAACGPPDRVAADAPDADDASVPDADVDVLGLTYVYANTPDSLYLMNPESLAVTKIGDFIWPSQPESITDIAIDKNGVMLGVSNSAVYRIDAATARLTVLSSGLIGGFNGLTFVPSAMVNQTGADVLVGTRAADGMVFRIDVTTGQATPIGDMGAFRSSGDLVSVTSVGTAQIATGAILGSPDRLVQLAPPGFSGTEVGTTGFGQVWGLAYWKNRLFGFTYAGDIIVVDQSTGKGTVVQSGGPNWFGAAVTTSAPIL
jgi:hypothetical protein